MSECKGTYWRYTINSFIDRNGNLTRKEHLRMLKRKSCNGECQPSNSPCQQTYVHECLVEGVYMMEDLPDLPKDVRNGDILRLVYSWFVDDFELYFEKVQ